MPNVFLSHRGTDAALARRLAVELGAAGHHVWLDEWEIGIGDSIIERMNQGLDDVTYVVVCYSSAGVLAPWMSREWMATIARQLDGRGV